MESGFLKASSENLPEVNYVMLQEFFAKNLDYMSVEIRGVKNERAARAGYGDDAVGYVQLRRESNKCILKARICPEHKVRSQNYYITAIIDEDNDVIEKCQCESCAAAQGGCKHAVAFLYWLLRKNDEKSPTSVECYWSKPKLSEVGTSMKYIKAKDLVPERSAESSDSDSYDVDCFQQKVIEEGKNRDCEALMLKYFTNPTEVEKMSVYYMINSYSDNTTIYDADDFINFCKRFMQADACRKVSIETEKQWKSTLWYELRYGRITASKLYEAGRCKTSEGILVESILGASNIPITDPMQRGLRLESAVLDVVAKTKNIKIKHAGLFLCAEYPVFGASPDGISNDFVVEIKCPSKRETLKNYIKDNGKVQPKYACQIQLQMLLCDRKKGLFCVASPDFEETNKVHIIEVEFNNQFIKVVLDLALEFWKKHIFPIIINKK